MLKSFILTVVFVAVAVAQPQHYRSPMVESDVAFTVAEPPAVPGAPTSPTCRVAVSVSTLDDLASLLRCEFT